MFDTTTEISKLLKFSPKRNAMFDRIKEAVSPETTGFMVLCPTRWTVRAACLQSVDRLLESIARTVGGMFRIETGTGNKTSNN